MDGWMDGWELEDVGGSRGGGGGGRGGWVGRKSAEKVTSSHCAVV